MVSLGIFPITVYKALIYKEELSSLIQYRQGWNRRNSLGGEKNGKNSYC